MIVHCNKCDEEFNDEELEIQVHELPKGEHRTTLHCPKCQSDDVQFIDDPTEFAE